jgi:mRNA interferase MazF
MAINFHPRPGNLLMCDFGTGFKPPEMVKTRPVVVMSRRNDQLAIVVPLSATEPRRLAAWHCEMSLESLAECLRHKRSWAKVDMVSCVALSRLDRIMAGKCPRTGKRLYVQSRYCSRGFGPNSGRFEIDSLLMNSFDFRPGKADTSLAPRKGLVRLTWTGARQQASARRCEPADA